jgi:predicted DNA-binding protein
VQKTLYISLELRERVKELAEKLGRSANGIYVEAIEDVIKKLEGAKK